MRFLLIVRFWPMLACFCLLACSPTWTMHTIDNTSAGADGAKLYDVNQDGQAEIVVGWEQGNVVRLYQQQASEQWTYVELPAPQVEDALVADLDGDGFPDVVSLSEGQHQRISIHWAPANWDDYWDSDQWLSEDLPATVGKTRWMYGQAAQIDGKHGLDLLVGSKDPNGTLGWLSAPADARNMAEWQYQEICPASWIMSIEWVDMNGDGQKDVLFTDRKGPHRGLKWAETPPQPGQVWTTHLIGMSEQEPMFLGMDQAESPNFIWVADHDAGMFGFSPTPSSASDWQLRYQLPFPKGSGTIGKSAAMGDIKSNGKPWVVSTYEGAKGTSGVMATRAPIPTRSNRPAIRIAGKTGIKYDFATLVDMDGDGDLDVLTCEEANNAKDGPGLGVIWYENPNEKTEYRGETTDNP